MILHQILEMVGHLWEDWLAKTPTSYGWRSWPAWTLGDMATKAKRPVGLHEMMSEMDWEWEQVRVFKTYPLWIDSQFSESNFGDSDHVFLDFKIHIWHFSGVCCFFDVFSKSIWPSKLSSGRVPDDKWRDAPRRMASKTFSPAWLKSPGSCTCI